MLRQHVEITTNYKFSFRVMKVRTGVKNTKVPTDISTEISGKSQRKLLGTDSIRHMVVKSHCRGSRVVQTATLVHWGTNWASLEA